MIFDGGKLKDSLLKFDFAIVGAGIAGITIAIELTKAGKRVGLFESGGLEFNRDIQDLYKGALGGNLNHAPLDAYRMRFFGGSSNCWGGGCLPYDPVDFINRSYLEKSGWPIPYSELLPYYKRAAHYLEIDSFDFEVDRKEIIRGIGSTGIFQTKYWKRNEKSPNFKEKYLDFFRQSDDSDLFLDANLSRIGSLSFDSEIEGLYFKSYNKNEFKVVASQYILSMGGIENARLLLNSKEIFTKPALKQTYENIGKYYSPHVNLMHGTFVSSPGIDVLFKYEQISSKVQFRRFLALLTTKRDAL